MVHDEPWSNIEVYVAGFLKLVNDYAGHISKVQRRDVKIPGSLEI